MRIEVATAEHVEEWVEMRVALWPHARLTKHRQEVAQTLASSRHEQVGLIAISDQGYVAGFAEASTRRDLVNGCDTSPVTFLEGIFVKPVHRRSGIARLLLTAVEGWGRSTGCTELASDTEWKNDEGRAFHTAAGFDETEHVIFFKK